MKLSPEVIEFFRNSEFAVLTQKLDLGAGEEGVVLVKSTGDLLEGFKKDSVKPELGWLVEETGYGPVVCLCLYCTDGKEGEIVGESFFDIFDESDAGLLGLIANQERMRVVMYDEKLELVYLAEGRWGEIHRITTLQAIDRAEELAEKTKTPDFGKALEVFQSAVSLDVVAAAAAAAGGNG